ncbi:N-acetylmuramoyl-L-alanine amidase [candidate division KSB1 bacterium]|nr:N-acetylmuramoyl-L-alanine amidase [candidate division KSB1 bacterium]
MLRFRFIAFLLITVSCSSAQTIRRFLPLDLTFPAPGDTFAVEKLRIAGYTDADAQVLINGTTVRTHPNGAFVDRIDLQVGWNTLRVESRLGDQIRRDSLQIFRQAPVQPSPHFPTRIDSGFFQPRSDIWLSAGDILHIEFKGSPGGHARFSVEGLIQDVPMTELAVEGSVPCAGFYHGVLVLDNRLVGKRLALQVELEGLDGRREKVTLPGRLYVMSDRLPLVGQTRKETELWNDAESGIRMGKLLPFVRLHIIGKICHRYKIRLSPSHIGFLACEDVRLLSVGEPLPHTWISAPRIAIEARNLRLIFDLSRAVPAIVRQTVHPAGLDLYLFGAHLASESVTWPNPEIELTGLSIDQVSEGVVKVHLDLAQGQQWGHGLDYQAGRLIWAIRRPPQLPLSNDRPLNGLSVCIDPGHGGEEWGAVGTVGTLEKEINLRIAFLFAEQLRRSGARPLLTRSEDRTIRLEERVEFARLSGCDLFISIHNNSIGAGVHPLRVRGTSIYFYQPQSQALAWAVYPFLVRLGLEPFGRNQAAFSVLRLTEMPAVLVECGFLSHPEEEMLLNEEAFARRLAAALVDGVVTFLRQSLR